MKLIAVLVMLVGAAGYAHADCYPGDSVYTSIVQEIYRGVTSDNIVLTSHSGSPTTRHALCGVLTMHHNAGKNTGAGQGQTNQDFLGFLGVSLAQCADALTYTQGYDDISDWQQWAGYHSGHWYTATDSFPDGAEWFDPGYESGGQYVVQQVRFDSQYRVENCVTPDQTGATCRDGWNQSGQGVRYIWGWDPKDDSCTIGGRRGAHVGFPFSVGSASCIVWVTTEEAFLECLKDGRRTSTTSGSGLSEGYGQWNVN